MAQRELVGQGRTADVYAWEDGRVLKLFHAWMDQDGVEYEARIGRLVYEAGLPAPRLYDLVELDGRYGIVYERLAGKSLMKSGLWTLIRSPRELAELHARLHAVHLDQLPSQRESLRRKIQRARLLADDLKSAALQALDGLPDDQVVCHGDFHPDNVILTARGPIVIDWVNATRGHPLADVAQTMLLISVGFPPGTRAPKRWLLGRVRDTYLNAYRRHYDRLRGVTPEQIEPWHLPLAAARLSEEIHGEPERLLVRIRAALPAAPARLESPPASR